MADETTRSKDKKLRGQGRGGRFFVLGRGVWDSLERMSGGNHLHQMLTFLVLLAGTGSDHRLTKWSIKSCEEYVGLGKPRARLALEQLVAEGLVERVEGASRLTPQYRLPEVAGDEDPIFLPVQLVTGFKGEASVLRRIRETGDPMVLRMLIDLYGLVDLDATYGVPIASLSLSHSDGGVRQIAEMGVHALWALELGQNYQAKGDWCAKHFDQSRKSTEWQAFWERLKTLRDIGAVFFEPWLFDSAAQDAEPLFPVDFGVLYQSGDVDDVSVLSRLLLRASEAMTDGREYLLEHFSSDVVVPLPLHHQTPALRGVAKLRVEPDSPGCRMAYGKRKALVAGRIAAYQRLLDDVNEGRFNRPLGAVA